MPDPIPVRVALRIRPLVPRETGDGCKECIKCIPGHPQVVIGEDKAFTYDYVFETYSKQEDLYNKTVIPLVEGFFKGYNATVLAYGQTGSGKTYSMGTAFTMCGETDETKGVIPRLINTIFKWIEERKDKTEFLLKVSFLEIHNEEIHDLLNPCPSDESRIAIRDTHDGGIKIAGLQELTVRCGEDLIRCLEQGSASRATGATAMNSRSSRSHAIFTITMEQKELQGSELRKAKFHLVDLAGSERVKKTHAQGERFKEGVNINKGLLALGNVISALSDELKKSNSHVPYRDSKLTRLLQDSLGGNSNTLMIACVSPADNNFEETLNTLRYADRARQIKNKPIVNIDPAAAELANLRQQVQMLQMQLLQGQTVAGTEQRETGNSMVAFQLQDLAKHNTSDPGQAAEGIDHSSSSPPSDSTIVSQHALRQAELGRQLQELTKALTLKEELANKMVANDSRLTSMRKQYEDTVRELEGEISRLEREKANLNLELSSTKSELSEGKTREKNRNRIKELEAKISGLKKKQVEQQKLLKLKEQSDSTIKKLNTEIQVRQWFSILNMLLSYKVTQDERALDEKKCNSLDQQSKITELEKELELRSSQISSLQYKIIDAEQGNLKLKYRSTCLSFTSKVCLLMYVS
ncbi:PREDICTED: chromosome-associated kinesin KIF4A-like [Acropora digitifera]|uniref:chromosome-associated kinesin KIF4A-like n=1 Tax=Acropora digitifera TaxID=70779 RepID=UPI00077AAD4F|nr:PREDICTED: chromosome-associated kinesin KIF4A-like [Acropora digitifera]